MRNGEGARVGDGFDSVRPQDCGQLIQAAGRMPDAPERHVTLASREDALQKYQLLWLRC